MSKIVNMREERDWLGRKRYVVYDTNDEPRTFHEIESEKIGDDFMFVMRLTCAAAFVVFCFYLWPWDMYWEGATEMSRMGYPLVPFFMGGGIWLIGTTPNLIVAFIRSIALSAVTGE